jgi:hypothetical protein
MELPDLEVCKRCIDRRIGVAVAVSRAVSDGRDRAEEERVLDCLAGVRGKLSGMENFKEGSGNEDA